MRVPCFECALRACGAFKPINQLGLAFINEMKRDHLKLPVGADIIAAGPKQAALYKRADVLGLVVNAAMEFPLTQQHIADALGLSLVHTNKSLAKLRRLGMFSQTNGTLLLSNPKALESVAQYFEEETPKRPLI